MRDRAREFTVAELAFLLAVRERDLRFASATAALFLDLEIRG